MVSQTPAQARILTTKQTLSTSAEAMVTTLPDGRPLVDNTGRAIKRKVSAGNSTHCSCQRQTYGILLPNTVPPR